MRFRKFHTDTGTQSIVDRRVLIEVPTTARKTYARFPQISLPSATGLTMSLIDGLENRRSATTFKPDASISLDDLASLLFAGAGARGDITDGADARHHPSGGALYPIECYVAAYRVDGIERGAYHYEIASHALARLPSEHPEKTIAEASAGLIPPLDPAAIIIFTALWDRSYPKYGEFAYRLALIETGHIAQNVLLAATARDVQARPIAGFRQEMVANALDIASDTEDPLYELYVGA